MMLHSTVRYLCFGIILCTSVATAKRFKKLEAITFNTGLAGLTTLPNNISIPRDVRRDHIINFLNATEADVVCLQEVWFGEDVQAIVEGVADVYPFSYTKIHRKDGSVIGSPRPKDGALCNQTLFLSLALCLTTECDATGPVDDTIECGFVNCFDEIEPVLSQSSEDCSACFFASYPDLEQVVTGCLGEPGRDTTLKKMNAPGLLMLSKASFKRAQYVDFFPKTNEVFSRGYLTAKVAGNLQVVCTHLSDSTIFGDAYVELNLAKRFSSYVGQNLFEISRLIKSVGRKKKALILGSLSSGPAFQESGVMELNIASYNALNNTFTTLAEDECTFCSDNAYTYEDVNYSVDHAFGKGVLIDDIKILRTIDVSSLYYNGTKMPLSDHEALWVSVKRLRG